MLRGAPITIFGDGHQMRDFVYVQDVAKHFVVAGTRAFQSDAGISETLNVCSGRRASINDLFDVLAHETGYALKPTFGPARAGDIKMSLGDPSAAQASLGIACSRSMSDGVREFCSSLTQKAQ
jgi:UDP-glucose 4-epimerase